MVGWRSVGWRSLGGAVLAVVLALTSVVLVDRSAVAQGGGDVTPNLLELDVSMLGDYAFDATLQLDIVVDGEILVGLVVEPPGTGTTAVFEIPGLVEGDDFRLPRSVRIETASGFFDSYDWGDLQWVCNGVDAGFAPAFEYVTEGTDTMSCAITAYGPWRLQLDTTTQPDGSKARPVFVVDGDPGFSLPAVFSGLRGQSVTIDALASEFDPGVVWTAQELTCDDGTVIALPGTESFTIVLDHDRAVPFTSCLVDFTPTMAPTQLVVASSSNEIAGRGSATLQFDDDDPEEWFFESVVRAYDGATTVTVEQVLLPDDEWDTVGISCTDGVNANWTDLGNGRSRAVIDVVADQRTTCVFENRFVPFFPPRVDVGLVLASIDGVVAPPVKYAVNDFVRPDPFLRIGDEPVTTSLTMADLHVIGLESPGPQWWIDLSCTGAILVQTQNAITSNGGSALLGSLDLSEADPVGGETCTATVVPSDPVMFEWTKVYPDDPTTQFVAQVEGRTAVVRDGETVSFLAAAGGVAISEYPVAGTTLESIICTVGDRTIEFVREADGGFIAPYIDDLAPGDLVACTSTSSGLDTTIALTIINNAPAPSTFTIGTDLQETIVTVADSLTINVERDVGVIAMQPGSNQRFESVECNDPQVQLMVPGIGLAILGFLEGTELTCTFEAVAAANDPINVTLTGVFEAPDGSTGSFTPVEFSYRIGEPFMAEFGPVPDPNVMVFEPLGWRTQGIECDAGLPALDGGGSVIDVISLVLWLRNVAPGSDVACQLTFLPEFTIPLTFSVFVEGEPNADVEVAFLLDDRPEPVVASSFEPASSVVNLDAGRLWVSPLAIPGFEPAGGLCRGVFGANLIYLRDGEWPYWNLSWGNATRVDCELTLRRIAPAQLVITTEVDGVVGNGGMRFTTTSGSQSLGVNVIDGAGTVTVDVPIGQVVVSSLVPGTWTNVSADCDRDYDVVPLDDGFVIQFRSGEVVECTFVNRLLNQQIGESGDVNCDGASQIVDALVIAQFSAQIRSGVASCPLTEPTVQLLEGAGDVNDDGATNIIDALIVARCAAGIVLPACPAVVAE